MKYFYRLMALALAMTSHAMMAQEVSVEEAQSRALNFLTRQTDGVRRAKGTDAAPVQPQLAYTSKQDGKTCFYVFNAGADQGFVIVGGNEAAHEILGYSDHGTFDYDKAPANFKWWLSQYTEQIARAEASGIAASAAQRAKAQTASRADIPALVEAKWNQEEPYYNLIEGNSGRKEKYVTGCVATAMAQVMYHHRCPTTTGTGSHSYTRGSVTYSADFGATTYQWNDMLLNYETQSYTDAQAEAVATLMYHAGVSVDMRYGTAASGGSGAVSEKIGASLVNYFGYDRSVRMEYRSYFSDEAWEDLVYAELQAGRPVLYSGQAASGAGHQFICDGYDSNAQMFRINWGWGSYCDGSYPLSGTDALYSEGSGTGGAGPNSAYTEGQMIILNVMPNAGGKERAHMAQPESDEISDALYLSVEGTTYEDNYDYTHSSSSQTCYLYSSLKNISCITTGFDCGVKATERTTGITQYWNSEQISLSQNSWYLSAYPLSFQPNELAYNGVYELRPVCRMAGGTDADWTEIDLLPSETVPTITVTGAVDPEPVDITFSIEQNTVQVARTLQITHESYYNGSVTYTSSNPSIATVDADGLITGVAEGSVTITAHGEQDGFFNETTTTFNITVTALVKEDVTFEISDTKLTINKTATISWDEEYDGTPEFTSSDNAIATVDANGIVTAVSEGTATITATAPATTFFNETVQQFTVQVIGGGIVMVEEPYFNNDNNAYEDDLVFNFKIMNATSETASIGLYYRLKIGYYTVRYDYTRGNVSPDGVWSGSLDLSIWPQNYEDIVFTPNEEYTVYLYKDEERTELYEYPSITFTYRNKLSVDYGVSPAGWGTLILPFNAEVPEGMTIYECSSVTDGVLNLEEATTISRNVPYIVEGEYSAKYSFVGPEAIDEDTPWFQKDVLVGAVTKTVPLVENTDYILQVQNDKAAFYKYTGTPSDDPDQNADGNRLAAQFRAFLRLGDTTGAASYGLPDIGGNGIEQVNPDQFLPAGIYSIDGKRRSALQKGMNLLILDDGTARKVFVK